MPRGASSLHFALYLLAKPSLEGFAKRGDFFSSTSSAEADFFYFVVSLPRRTETLHTGIRYGREDTIFQAFPQADFYGRADSWSAPAPCGPFVYSHSEQYKGDKHLL